MSISALALCRAIRQTGRRPRSYSGRGMYGARCVGVTIERGEEMELGRDLADYELGEEGERLPRACTDSMGLDVILYWPAVEWTKACNPLAADPEDEEDE